MRIASNVQSAMAWRTQRAAPSLRWKGRQAQIPCLICSRFACAYTARTSCTVAESHGL